jgi:hypothetical protein
MPRGHLAATTRPRGGNSDRHGGAVPHPNRVRVRGSSLRRSTRGSARASATGTGSSTRCAARGSQWADKCPNVHAEVGGPIPHVYGWQRCGIMIPSLRALLPDQCDFQPAADSALSGVQAACVRNDLTIYSRLLCMPPVSRLSAAIRQHRTVACRQVQ